MAHEIYYSKNLFFLRSSGKNVACSYTNVMCFFTILLKPCVCVVFFFLSKYIIFLVAISTFDTHIASCAVKECLFDDVVDKICMCLIIVLEYISRWSCKYVKCVLELLRFSPWTYVLCCIMCVFFPRKMLHFRLQKLKLL